MFAIIGKEDRLLYQNKTMVHTLGTKKEYQYQLELALHASLDDVDPIIWRENGLEWINIGRVHENSVSCLITPGNTKMMLLHGPRPKDSISRCLAEAYEVYVKQMMSPFYTANTPITSMKFDEKIKEILRKYL